MSGSFGIMLFMVRLIFIKIDDCIGFHIWLDTLLCQVQLGVLQSISLTGMSAYAKESKICFPITGYLPLLLQNVIH